MNFFNGPTTNNAPAPLNLNKGQILDLTKTAPSLKNVILGAGWDTARAGSDNFDLDISAFLLDKNGRVTNAGTQVVFFNALCQTGIYLEGDNRTGAGDGDDERIHVNLDEIPTEIETILFNVNIFDAMQKRQTFGMVDNSYIRLLDVDDGERELCRYELKRDASNSTAVVFAKLFRVNGGWSFQAVGEGMVVADLNQLLLKYM